jgi:hypothetical protein
MILVFTAKFFVIHAAIVCSIFEPSHHAMMIVPI